MSTYPPELREKIKAKYAELRSAGWSRSKAHEMAEAHVMRALNDVHAGIDSCFQASAQESSLDNCGRYGRRTADVHGWHTRSNPSTAYDFKPSVQANEIDLECLTAQVFDECLQAGMSMRAAHYHTLAFMQEARGRRPRTSTLDGFDDPKQALFGDGPYVGRRFGRRDDGHGSALHKASDTPGHGQRSGRRPIFVELYRWCFRPFELVLGKSSSRHSSESFLPSPFSASTGRRAGEAYRTEERKPGGRSSGSTEYAEFSSPYTTHTAGPRHYTISYRSPRGNLDFEWTFFGSDQRPYGDHDTSNTRNFPGNHQQPRNNYHRDEIRSRNRRASRPSEPQRAGPRPFDTSSTLPQGIKPGVCFYDVLGVSNSVSTGEIKKAHRTLSLRWHPDRAASWQRREATKKMALINQARDVLLDDSQRAYYDRTGWMPPNMRV